MKTIIAAAITCIGLFGLSLGVSNYLLKKSDVDETKLVDGDPAAATTEDESKLDVQAVPVSFRPEEAVSVEAVVQMSDSIRRMEQQLVQREQRVAKDENRVALLLNDLQTEQEELRAFSEGIDAKVELLQRLSGTIESQLADLEDKRAELKAMEKAAGEDPQSKQEDLDNKVNDVKSWFAGLEAEQAADYLKEFANNGKLEFAASLLDKMPDRQKSKILGAMSDPVLVDQLIDSLSSRPSKK
ncbi:hypothetical protein [Stieleria varia]|uniref:Magnesium transporter MgtE intracellular domain-containing protein n=1 Tax=Stieleria varia TaxID=2528005 RepID=A0A5C6ARZ2_9BACT|nr:hypothetical protein [Stieleria varia]TWU02177.1 hypothetical protein Pla52n_32260 [Stieleria varia]